MQLLPGNIELTQNPFEKVVWNLLRSELKYDEGILGYKMPSLGSKDSAEIPSFIFRSQLYGIIVIDVVSSKIIDFKEDFQFWIKPDGEEIYSRDIITSNYCRDIKNKLSKSTKLFNNKTEKFLFGDKKNPVKSLVIFPDNKMSDFEDGDFVNESINPIIDKDYSNEIKKFILSCKASDITHDQIDEIDSILEGTSVFNRKRERILEEGKTRNDLIKNL
ncbi:MAG: hypothetical protein LUD02_07635 [Tannerellaceae bacterium]|nr:hypothetical protein [Tannerellaceae bacterium]